MKTFESKLNFNLHILSLMSGKLYPLEFAVKKGALACKELFSAET